MIGDRAVVILADAAVEGHRYLAENCSYEEE